MKDLLKDENIEVEQSNSDEILFDINSLHNSKFKELVQYYDSISGSSTEYLLTATLASLAGTIGKNVYFKISNSIKIYSNIYAMLIGKSSIMYKSSALSLTTRELQRIDDSNRYQYEKELKEYEQKAKKNKLNDSETNFEFQKPIRDYLLFPQDNTVESLTDILSTSIRGLFIHNELGGWLASMNKGYSGDSKMFFTNLFDVPKSYEVSRVVKGSTYLHRPFLSICGASTIDWIIENSKASDITSGFFARFIYSIRKKPTKEYIPLLKLKGISTRLEDRFNAREIYERLVTLPPKTEIEITKVAADVHINYDNKSYERLLQLENDNQLSFEVRLLIYSIKFAMIICLTDNRNVIEKRDIEDAILLTEYYKKNVELLLGKELVQTEFTINEEKIFNIIKHSENGIIKRSVLMNKTRLKAKELNEILQNLIEKEKIVEEYLNNKNGRKKYKIYKVNRSN